MVRSAAEAFEEVYTKFKLHFYREVFGRFAHQDTELTTVEAFCMEVIHAMKNPSVNEFASFINISSPNAAYKVNSLVRKGYLQKVRSQTDRREYYLIPTEKFEQYYQISYKYEHAVWERLEQALEGDELVILQKALLKLTDELMCEVPEYRKDHLQKDAGTGSRRTLPAQ